MKQADPRDAVIEAASKLSVWVDIYCHEDWDGVPVFERMLDANVRLTHALAALKERKARAA